MTKKLESKFENLIQRYKKTLKQAEEEARPYLKSAKENLKEITKICEKYGVPMDPGISIINGNEYFPKSFKKKWPELINLDDDDDILFQLEIDIQEFGGWQHSQVCTF